MTASSATARAAILARISQALRPDGAGVGEAPEASGDPLTLAPEVVERLAQRPLSTRPGSRSVDRAAERELLIRQMEATRMSVVRLATLRDVPAAVTEYLASQSISGTTSLAPALATLDWPDDFRSGAATGDEATAVTPCLAGVAETGSLLVVSGAGTPASLNFLPENHLLVLHENRIVRHLEDVWPLLRAEPVLPRATTLITGPSRTADIEQTLEIGAHGPRRVHVMLVAEGA